MRWAVNQPFKFMITSGCKSLLKICFENSKHSLIRFVTYNNLHNVNDMKQDILNSRLLGDWIRNEEINS